MIRSLRDGVAAIPLRQGGQIFPRRGPLGSYCPLAQLRTDPGPADQHVMSVLVPTDSFRCDSLLAEEHERDSPDGRSHLCGRRYGWGNGDLACSALSLGPAGSLGHRGQGKAPSVMRGRGFLDCAPGLRQQCWAQLISSARCLSGSPRRCAQKE